MPNNTTIPITSPHIWTDVYDTPYSSQYNTVANAFFLGLIIISLVGCLLISWRTQRCIPFSFVLCVAFLMEIISYALRFSGWSVSNFTTSVGLSTIAPIFITIAIHLSSAEVITNLGEQHAPLSPNAHLRIFIWTDILAALLQGIGLALTFAGARPMGTWRLRLPLQATAGQSILFTGLFLQCLGLAAALVCLTITYIRAGKADRRYGYSTFQHHRGASAGTAGHLPLTPRSKTFLAILPLAGVCVLVRCAYRAAAAWGGIGSPIARNNVLWLVAEGVLLTEAMVTLAVFHPAIWLDDTTSAAATRQKPHHHDMEAAAASGGVGAATQGKQTRMSMFTIGSASSRGAKRLSYATTIGGDMHEPEQAQLHHHYAHAHARGDSGGADMHEASQLMFQSHLIAPSDAGSSRRSSSGSSSAPDPYLHRPGLYDAAASPYDNTRGNRYSAEEEDHAISPETRDLSPLEAEAEADRISIVPEVPRKSSKRASRLMSPGSAAAAAAAAAGAGAGSTDEEEDDEVFELPRKSSKRLSRGTLPTTSAVHEEEEGDDGDDDDDDRLEVASVTLPLRKPSRRETTTTDDDALEDVALRSTYSTSLYSQ